MASSKVVMLIANETNPTNLQNADRLRTLLQSKKIVWEEIDGTDPNNKEKRSELFGVSGLRAEYPQLFFQDPASSQYLFIGNYYKVAALNENVEMLRFHPEILEHNPDVLTFDKVFAEVMPAVVANKDTQLPPVENTSDMHFDFDALDELEAEQKTIEVKATAEDGKVECKVEAEEEWAEKVAKKAVEEAVKRAQEVLGNEDAKAPKQQKVESVDFAMSFEQQDPANQLESPMTLSPRSVRIMTQLSALTLSPRSVRTDLVEEGKEEKEQQGCESNEVVLLDKDTAEDTDEKTTKAEEKRKESSKKTQGLRKRDRVKRWFKRLTCTQRT